MVLPSLFTFIFRVCINDFILILETFTSLILIQTFLPKHCCPLSCNEGVAVPLLYLSWVVEWVGSASNPFCLHWINRVQEENSPWLLRAEAVLFCQGLYFIQQSFDRQQVQGLKRKMQNKNNFEPRNFFLHPYLFY